MAAEKKGGNCPTYNSCTPLDPPLTGNNNSILVDRSCLLLCSFGHCTFLSCRVYPLQAVVSILQAHTKLLLSEALSRREFTPLLFGPPVQSWQVTPCRDSTPRSKYDSCQVANNVYTSRMDSPIFGLPCMVFICNTYADRSVVRLQRLS